MDSHNKVFRKENPRLKTNPISALYFIYMIPIFWKNYKSGLKEDDLHEVLEEHKCSTLGDTLEKAWKPLNMAHPKYALHLALFKVFGREFALIGLGIYITEFLLLVVLPFSIGKLVTYFEKGPPAVTEGEAYIHAGTIVITILVDSAITHPLVFALTHMGMKIRVACCSLIYRKSLKLSNTALGETTVGQTVNLLSNDVRKFEERFVTCHYVWMSPIQVAIGTYLLYQLVGVAVFAGVGFLLLFVPLQVFLGKYNSKVRLRTALRTDERVRLMNEIFSGIQVIKLYSWEKPFAKLVSLARRYEIKAVRLHYYIESFFYVLFMTVARTSIFITIVAYVYLGNDLTADVAYSITVIFGLLRSVATLFFSVGIIAVTEVHISILRLQSFLCQDELISLPCGTCSLEKDCKNIEKEEHSYALPRISLRNAFAKWDRTKSDHNLNDINLDIENKKLVTVIGTVGSGKTTLLNAILKELPLSGGDIDITGTVSYASQEPWLFCASIKQNVLFGNKFDEDRYKTVIRVCSLDSDLATFSYGDSTIVSEKGKSLSGGQKARISLARCIYKTSDIYLLDDPLSAVDTKVGKYVYNNCIQNFLSNKICILITHQLQYVKTADMIVIMDDGKIVANGKFEELQSNGMNFAKLLRQFHNDEQVHSEIKVDKVWQNEKTEYNAHEKLPIKNKETGVVGSIGVKTYTAYFGSGGVVTVTLMLILLIAAYAAGIAADYYVSYWVNLEQDRNMHTLTSITTFDRDFVVLIYSTIIIAAIILGLACSFSFFAYFMRVSVNIHDTIFSRISFATMKFFDGNPTGRILNRFSKDMGIIDEYIPIILMDVVDISLVFIGTITLSSIINPYLLLPTVILVSIFYYIRILYLHTSRSAKRIEGMTRSPIFNHLTTTLCGLPTIRAFNAQKMLNIEFETHQDLHSSAWFLFISSNRAFGIMLDAICLVFIALIIFSLLLLNKGYYGGDVGLIVSQIIGLSGILQWGMRQWTELENYMTSVERVLEYTTVEREPVRTLTPSISKNWPKFGKIEFQNVTMKYDPNGVSVLKNLQFTIYPREKIGIVGRTGAGKTSIIAALFQLYEIEGSIVIDDINTLTLPLEIIRPKISIIPQEPALYSGTLRKNLDPFEEYNDDALWNALEQVELKRIIKDSPGGLGGKVIEGGANFSTGQRQLICLARALIRNCKILVMDEATANVDPHTDSLIQKTIRQSFVDCTVLTIAHRLHTVMDSDRILVMDGGEAVEFDHPHILLQNANGVFLSLVQTAGDATTQNLKAIAKQSFENWKP